MGELLYEHIIAFLTLSQISDLMRADIPLNGTGKSAPTNGSHIHSIHCNTIKDIISSERTQPSIQAGQKEDLNNIFRE